mmetsp:Transcript_3239/g.4459  ORF Transcript_3239/g.4459 Transcript_3239/m.4459 type:complete len:213 (+) Transcript_3239:2364-3002(+)
MDSSLLSVTVTHPQFPDFNPTEVSKAVTPLAATSTVVNASTPLQVSPNRTSAIVKHSGLTFMIVDDTATSRKITRRLLCSLGHAVQEAVDGLDFLHKMGISYCDNSSKLSNRSSDWVVRLEDFKMEKEAFTAVDIILMDDNMPNLSGPEATAVLRHCGYTGIVFGVTGNAFHSQIENFLSKGANKVFSKPLNLRLLEEEIRASSPDLLDVAD